MPYDLCIFDLDGTLTDPKLGITRSYQYALAGFGIHEALEDLERFIGPPLRDNFRDNYGFSDSETEKAVALFREFFAETGLFENYVYPDICVTLQKLKNAGKTLAVATNKYEYFAEKVLCHFDLDKYFAYISGDAKDGSLTINGKLDIIRIVLEKLDPKRRMSAVMIGDRKHDIIGARENGIESIGVTWGYGSGTELEEAGATMIAGSVEELYRMLI